MPVHRLRLLHVITRLVLGGAQENTLLTVARLDRRRYDITLASGPTTGPEGSLEDRIPKDIAFARIPDLVRDPHPVKDVMALGRLYALMRRDRYDIVHTHTTKAGLLGRLAARLARIPLVVHTPHGHAFHDYLSSTGSEGLKLIERWLARWTDRIICLTEAEREDHVRFRIAARDRFDVIHSGVDIGRFRDPRVAPETKRRALGLAPGGPIIGCVARLVPVKGVQYLLDAVPLVRAAVPGITVVFAGDGPLRADLERRARALGLNGVVHFLGLRQDVPDLMHMCDVLVLPSLNEGMGRVAVEALAAGRPVIGTRVSGIHNVVADGKTGLLVPPADSGALAGAIIRCLAEPAMTRAMGARAREQVEAYSIERMIDKIERLYGGLLEKRRGGPREDRRP